MREIKCLFFVSFGSLLFPLLLLIILRQPDTRFLTAISNATGMKVIQFRGKFYKGKTLPDYCIMDPNTMEFCPYKCTYTTDPSYAGPVDAVVVHGRDDNRFPKAPHPAGQLWVFLMFESPFYSFTNISLWNHIFNWTMTYRRDSDIPIHYGSLRPKGRDGRFKPFASEEFKMNLKTRKLAACAVSNCNPLRLSLIKALEGHIPLDIYGACGNLTCEGASTYQCDQPQKCHEFLSTRYKFYLAFENSHCDNYITEKFFNALKYGLVPVVNGPTRADYEAVAPPSSFIHLEDFSSVQQLAKYLQHLDQHEEEYLKYFEWKDYFTFDDKYYFQRAWCDLCTKLHVVHNASGIVSSHQYSIIEDWWFRKDSNGGGFCRQFVLNEDGNYFYLNRLFNYTLFHQD